MILDYALCLEPLSAAITTSAATTDYLDMELVAPNLGTRSRHIELAIIINVTGTGAGTFTFSLQGDDNTSFSSPTTLAATGAIVGTACTAGTVYRLLLPAEHERYIRGYVTVASTVGAMKFAAYLVHQV